MTADTNLSARLDEYLRHENFHETNYDLTDRACGDAYREGQLITLSDHEAAVKSAVDAEWEVGPLGWMESDKSPEYLTANTGFGIVYRISAHRGPDNVMWWLGSVAKGEKCADIPAAKAAAQEDYKARKLANIGGAADERIWAITALAENPALLAIGLFRLLEAMKTRPSAAGLRKIQELNPECKIHSAEALTIRLPVLQNNYVKGLVERLHCKEDDIKQLVSYLREGAHRTKHSGKRGKLFFAAEVIEAVLEGGGGYVMTDRVERFAAHKAEINRLAEVLIEAWAKAEPNHNVTKFPSSYVATFADMARAVIATNTLAERVMPEQSVETLATKPSMSLSERTALCDRIMVLEIALRCVMQTLAWQCFGACRGYSEQLLTPVEAESVAISALHTIVTKGNSL